MKIGIFLLVAAFDPARKAAGDRLAAEILAQCGDRDDVLFAVTEDHARSGSLAGWKAFLAWSREGQAREGLTHTCVLSDDSILAPHFVECLVECVTAFPDRVLCFQSNFARAKEIPFDVVAYETPDGCTLFGGTAPIAKWNDHAEWRERRLKSDAEPHTAGDLGVNLWLIERGEQVVKPIPSLVDHDLSLPSLDGNQHHTSRKLSERASVLFDPNADLRGRWKADTLRVARVGRTYENNIWEALYRTQGILTDDGYRIGPPGFVERVYEAHRGRPVSKTPKVFLASPIYTTPVTHFLMSRTQVEADLAEHGIGSHVAITVGDSLVQRARNYLVHEFLKSDSTHFFFWDADLEVSPPWCVRAMLESGHPIVGGVYPFRVGGTSNANFPVHMFFAQQIVDADETFPVKRLPTGFLMVKREVIVELCERHPELLHVEGVSEKVDYPSWALFDCRLVQDNLPWRKRYMSEDYGFCDRAAAAGYEIRCYLPPVFRHWGLSPTVGHLTELFFKAPETLPAPGGT